MRSSFLGATLIAAALGGPAVAQPTPPSPEQAQALEHQIGDILRALVIDPASLPPRPVEFAVQGDHYAMRLPFGGLGLVDPADAALTANLQRLDATRWALTDERVPAQFTVTTTMTMPDQPDAKNPFPSGVHQEAVGIEVKIGEQSSIGVFDPTYATPSSNETTAKSVDILRHNGQMARLTHFDHLSAQTRLTAAASGHVDAVSQSALDGYASETGLADGSTFKMTAKSITATARLDNLAADRLLPVLHDAMGASKLAANDQADPSAVQAGWRQALVAAQGLLTGMRTNLTATDLRFDVGGHAGALAKAEITLAGQAPQDRLGFDGDLTLDGLVIDDLPPPLAAYVPTHFSVNPVLGNLSVAALTKTAMDNTAPHAADAPAPPPFDPVGMTFGFDGLGLDIAGTAFTGVAAFVLGEGGAVDGAADITARGFDALIAKAQADPMLGRAVPVLIFLNGIAHANQGASVWQITAVHGKWLVNGVDLAAMAGGMPR